jgi:hypothetical protein
VRREGFRQCAETQRNGCRRGGQSQRNLQSTIWGLCGCVKCMAVAVAVVKLVVILILRWPNAITVNHRDHLEVPGPQ